ncbi:uncharacterized protein [Ptychodera flava]|uniref:uncharacterized protein n=1 Tax=Ptychodera flava TaxID=63121 RepID=UPI003969DECB
MLTHKWNIPQYLDLDVLGEPKPDDKNILLFKHLLNEIAKYRGKYQKSIKSIKAAQYEAQMLEARLQEMKSAKAVYHYDPAERFDLTMVKFFKQKREQVAELTKENRKLKNILQGLHCEDGKGKTEKSDIEGNEASKGQDEEELIKYLEDLLRPIEDFKKSEDFDNEEASSRALLDAAVLDGNLDIVKQVLSRYEARRYIQEEEKSALHQAIEEKKIDAIRVLVENGADIVSFDLRVSVQFLDYNILKMKQVQATEVFIEKSYSASNF